MCSRRFFEDVYEERRAGRGPGTGMAGPILAANAHSWDNLQTLGVTR